MHAESSGPHGHRLVVMNATVGVDDGNYKCTLGSTDDRNPREVIDFTLKLHKTTSFKDTARHLVLATGQQGALVCRVDFDPNVLSASVSWVRDQKPIEMFNDSAYSITEYDPSRQLSQLIIAPLTKHHDGTYTCRAAAVTSNLSKISDHDIQLETNYAPTFDRDAHTVWVERSQSALPGRQQHQQQANVYARPAHPHQSARGRHNKQHYPGAGSPNRRPAADNQPELEEGVAAGNGSAGPQIVRVELRCTSQANPSASILWSSTQNSMFILAKGEPAHVLEEPRVEIEGHNTTSILVIGYNLDLDWMYRRDSYLCSASNKIGKASKTFTIEQGDPPPAFNVGPIKQYTAQNSLFKFTLLGPNFEHTSDTLEPAPAEIVPPVDSFRIRAENPLLAGANLQLDNPRITQQQTNSYWSPAKRLNEPSVQWSLSNNQLAESNLRLANFNQPQNVTVNLGRLPSGNQKLFLEAHNAVGWSPNATYLGDYYIVSGCSSLLPATNWLTLSICLILLTLANFATGKQKYI